MDVTTVYMPISIPANVLILAPAQDSRREKTCLELLTPSSADRVNVLWITLTDSTDDRLDSLVEHVDSGILSNVTFIDVGETTGTSAGPKSEVPSVAGAVSIETVSSPQNMTRLGVKITNTLADWADNDGQTVLCLDSLSAMLQYVEMDQMYQFLHVLMRNVRSENVLAHYHMDPRAHEDQAVNTVRTLVDDVVEPSDENTNTGIHQSPPEPARQGDPSGTEAASEHRTTIADGEIPSEAVLRGLAEVTGTDPADMDTSLFEWVDPDSLDSLLTPSMGVDGRTVSVRFEWDDYGVLVDDETVVIRDGPTAADEG